jgi:predicted DNA-binding transcriptional regulator AlpA
MSAPDPEADWWTMPDIASYIGVALSTVSSYRTRGQMPPPDQTIGRTPVWRPSRIIEWHQSRPRHGGLPNRST